MSATYVPSHATEIRYDDSTTSLGATNVQHAVERLVQGGSVDKTYVHYQLTPAAVWTISHGLGKEPAIQCFDSAGSFLFGLISHSDNNTSDVSFYSAGIPVAIGGHATCN